MKKLSLFGLIAALTFILMPSGVAKYSNPYGGLKIPPPSENEIILTIQKGAISKEISMKDLRSMKSLILTIDEPFVKRTQSFRAIPLKDLFSLVGIKGDDKVQTIALNSYIYTNSAANFIAADGYLAFSRANKPIRYDQGGPIRIIYPDKSRWTNFLDPWNWSLTRLKVK